MKYELTHDSIAKQIFEKASTEARTRRKVENIIKERHEAFMDPERKSSMTQEDLEYVKPFLNEVNISEEQADFLKQQQHKLERRASIIEGAILLIMTALAGLTIFSIEQLNQAESERNQALYQNLTTKALYAFQQNDANYAYKFGMLAFKMFEDSIPARQALTSVLDQRKEQIFRPLHALMIEHDAPVRSLEFDRGGGSVLSTHSDGVAKVFNLGDRQTMKAVSADRLGFKELELVGHSDEIIAAGFTLFGENIFTISLDNTIRLWSNQGKEVNRLNFDRGQIRNAFISNLFGSVLITTDAGDLVLLDATMPNLRFREAESPGQGQVKFASISPDGQYFLIMFPARVEIRDLEMKLIRAIDLQSSEISTAAISATGESIVIVYKNQGARLWTAEKNGARIEMKQHMDKHEGPINSVCFSDSMLILTSSDDYTAGLWTAQGELITFLKGHTARVNNASFSADGKYIFTTSDDGTARLWSLQKEEKTMSGYNVELSAVLKDNRFGSAIELAKFSPDDGLHGVQWIATASNDGQVHFWDASALSMLKRIGAYSEGLLNPETVKYSEFQLEEWGGMQIPMSNADSLLVQKFENFLAEQNSGLWYLLRKLIYPFLLVVFIVFWRNRKRIIFFK